MAEVENRDGILWVVELEGEWILGPAAEAHPVPEPEPDLLQVLINKIETIEAKIDAMQPVAETV